MELLFTSEIAKLLNLDSKTCRESLVETGYLNLFNNVMSTTPKGIKEFGCGLRKIKNQKKDQPAWPWPNPPLLQFLEENAKNPIKLSGILAKAIFPTSATENNTIHLDEQKGRKAKFEFHSLRFNRILGYDSEGELEILKKLSKYEEVSDIRTQCMRLPFLGEKDKLEHYYPDIVVSLKDGRQIIIEVFSKSFSISERYCRIKALLKTFAEHHGIGYLMVMPCGTSLTELTATVVPPLLYEYFGKLIHRGTIVREEYETLKKLIPHEDEILIAMVHQYGLCTPKGSLEIWKALVKLPFSF